MKFIDRARLEQSFEGLDDDAIQSAYHQNYLMVTYLVERYGRHTLNDLVVEAARTGDIELAVKRIYGQFQVDYQTLQTEWYLQAVGNHGLIRNVQ